MVDSYGTVTKKGKSDAELEKIVRNNFDLRPGMIIKALNLMNIKYKPTSIGGHFGRVEEGFPWEQAKQLKV
jgi:S-adenosylmethionine synthetase